MILSFSGDPFLIARAARRVLHEEGIARSELVELGEGMDAATVLRQGSQGGLFGRVGILLDLDAAFSGQAGVKPRNEVIEALAKIPPDTVVAVLDQGATPARQKRYREVGTHQHLPTPRFGALTAWVRAELQSAGLRFDREVPDTLVDLFGEDLPGIAGEIVKLQALGEELTSARVGEIAGRLAARDAFDLIAAIARADAPVALEICRSLVSQGEPPARVLGALSWQFDLVARCVALRESRGRLSEGDAAAALGVKPFLAKKALAIAQGLDEDRLRQVLAAILRSDRAIKGGAGETWALEALAIEMCDSFATTALGSTARPAGPSHPS